MTKRLVCFSRSFKIVIIVIITIICNKHHHFLLGLHFYTITSSFRFIGEYTVHARAVDDVLDTAITSVRNWRNAFLVELATAAVM